MSIFCRFTKALQIKKISVYVQAGLNRKLQLFRGKCHDDSPHDIVEFEILFGALGM